MYIGIPKRKDSPFKIMTLEELSKQYPYSKTNLQNLMYSEDGGYRWHKVPEPSIVWENKGDVWLFTIIGA